MIPVVNPYASQIRRLNTSSLCLGLATPNCPLLRQVPVTRPPRDLNICATDAAAMERWRRGDWFSRPSDRSRAPCYNPWGKFCRNQCGNPWCPYCYPPSEPLRPALPPRNLVPVTKEQNKSCTASSPLISCFPPADDRPYNSSSLPVTSCTRPSSAPRDCSNNRRPASAQCSFNSFGRKSDHHCSASDRQITDKDCSTKRRPSSAHGDCSNKHRPVSAQCSIHSHNKKCDHHSGFFDWHAPDRSCSPQRQPRSPNHTYSNYHHPSCKQYFFDTTTKDFGNHASIFHHATPDKGCSQDRWPSSSHGWWSNNRRPVSARYLSRSYRHKCDHHGGFVDRHASDQRCSPGRRLRSPHRTYSNTCYPGRGHYSLISDGRHSRMRGGDYHLAITDKNCSPRRRPRSPYRTYSNNHRYQYLPYSDRKYRNHGGDYHLGITDKGCSPGRRPRSPHRTYSYTRRPVSAQYLSNSDNRRCGNRGGDYHVARSDKACSPSRRPRSPYRTYSYTRRPVSAQYLSNSDNRRCGNRGGDYHVARSDKACSPGSPPRSRHRTYSYTRHPVSAHYSLISDSKKPGTRVGDYQLAITDKGSSPDRESNQHRERGDMDYYSSSRGVAVGTAPPLNNCATQTKQRCEPRTRSVQTKPCPPPGVLPLPSITSLTGGQVPQVIPGGPTGLCIPCPSLGSLPMIGVGGSLPPAIGFGSRVPPFLGNPWSLPFQTHNILQPNELKCPNFQPDEYLKTLDTIRPSSGEYEIVPNRYRKTIQSDRSDSKYRDEEQSRRYKYKDIVVPLKDHSSSSNRHSRDSHRKRGHNSCESRHTRRDTGPSTSSRKSDKTKQNERSSSHDQGNAFCTCARCTAKRAETQGQAGNLNLQGGPSNPNELRGNPNQPMPSNYCTCYNYNPQNPGAGPNYYGNPQNMNPQNMNPWFQNCNWQPQERRPQFLQVSAPKLQPLTKPQQTQKASSTQQTSPVSGSKVEARSGTAGKSGGAASPTPAKREWSGGPCKKCGVRGDVKPNSLRTPTKPQGPATPSSRVPTKAMGMLARTMGRGKTLRQNMCNPATGNYSWPWADPSASVRYATPGKKRGGARSSVMSWQMPSRSGSQMTPESLVNFADREEEYDVATDGLGEEDDESVDSIIGELETEDPTLCGSSSLGFSDAGMSAQLPPCTLLPLRMGVGHCSAPLNAARNARRSRSSRYQLMTRGPFSSLPASSLGHRRRSRNVFFCADAARGDSRDAAAMWTDQDDFQDLLEDLAKESYKAKKLRRRKKRKLKKKWKEKMRPLDMMLPTDMNVPLDWQQMARVAPWLYPRTPRFPPIGPIMLTPPHNNTCPMPFMPLGNLGPAPSAAVVKGSPPQSGVPNAPTPNPNADCDVGTGQDPDPHPKAAIVEVTDVSSKKSLPLKNMATIKAVKPPVFGRRAYLRSQSRASFPASNTPSDASSRSRASSTRNRLLKSVNSASRLQVASRATRRTAPVRRSRVTMEDEVLEATRAEVLPRILDLAERLAQRQGHRKAVTRNASTSPSPIGSRKKTKYPSSSKQRLQIN